MLHRPFSRRHTRAIGDEFHPNVPRSDARQPLRIAPSAWHLMNNAASKHSPRPRRRFFRWLLAARNFDIDDAIGEIAATISTREPPALPLHSH